MSIYSRALIGARTEPVIVVPSRPALTMTGASYDTSDKVFGTSSLSGGYGTTTANILPTSGPWTVGARFKVGGNDTRTLIAAGPGNTGGAFWIGLDGSSHVVFFLGTEYITASGSIYDSSWHDAELDYDPAGICRAFVDGNLIGTYDNSGGGAGVNYASPLSVGALSDGSTPWGGKIDEVHVWSTYRHTSSFTTAASAYVGNEAGLLGLYHLDGSGVSA